MNNRLKAIRIQLNLSQEEFGSRIGIKSRAHISSLENGSRNITDRIIKDLVSVYNVNEEWLRTGNESLEPFNAPDTFSLDEYAHQRQVSDLELDIIKLYFELDSDTRRGLLKHFKDGLLKDKAAAEKKDDEEDLSPPRVAEEVKAYSSKEPSVEELEEEYKKNVLGNVPKPDVSVSSGIEGDINKVV